MNRNTIGLYCSLALLFVLSSCNDKKTDNNRLVINEVLVDNQTNFQDDYGVHSAWVEVFNKSYSSANLAGCYLKASSTPGDTVTYFIPKGDVTTKIPARQHALFWADGLHTRGTYHTNFVLSKTNANWIGLYDSGRNLIDQVVIPAGLLKPDQSYARVLDANEEWEVKDATAEKYVTPSTNNKVIQGNPKMEKFQEHDSLGIGMAITAMLVVFAGLFLLYILFKNVGRVAKAKLNGQKPAPAPHFTKPEKTVSRTEEMAPVAAAIAMALHEAYGVEHDVESAILTIVPKRTTPWSAKNSTLRDVPFKK